MVVRDRAPEMLDKLVIVNAPHPGVFAELLTSDPAQQQGQPIYADVPQR